MEKYKYVKTDWQDHLVDLFSGEIIQQGTRFTAQRANNIEDGIVNLYGSQNRQDYEIQKLRVQLEMVGRAPINNGTFFDTLDGDTKQLQLDNDRAVVQSSLGVGATSIPLNAAPFTVGEFVTIYDNNKSEQARITAINGNGLTVAALTNAYPKGAFVGRSNTIVDTGAQKLKFGTWGTYSIAVSEVV